MYLIADLITRIKNANIAEKNELTARFSGINKNLCAVLKENGYIVDYKVFKEGAHKQLSVTLDDDNINITDIKVVSKPGRRMYANVNDLKAYRKNIGLVIISTPKGVLSREQALEKSVGGEVLCRVW